MARVDDCFIDDDDEDATLLTLDDAGVLEAFLYAA